VIARRSSKPVVLVPSCNRVLGQHPFHIAGRKYIEAVRLAGALPLIVPVAHADEIDELLDLADGVLLTGSPSNVHPRHFGEDVHDTSLPLDTERDDWTLPMIPRVIERGIPLFAICRGFQEANVALGRHAASGRARGRGPARPPRRRRCSPDAPAELVYGLAHPVDVQPGGALAEILPEPRIQVNSVHGQGVNRLAPGLRIEARAPDGLVEAFSVEHAKGFNLCVQWHPEWQAATNPISVRLLRAFGDACTAYRDRHRAPEPPR
jgi:putative glutamine amidotransferase